MAKDNLANTALIDAKILVKKGRLHVRKSLTMDPALVSGRHSSS